MTTTETSGPEAVDLTRWTVGWSPDDGRITFHYQGADRQGYMLTVTPETFEHLIALYEQMKAYRVKEGYR